MKNKLLPYDKDIPVWAIKIRNQPTDEFWTAPGLIAWSRSQAIVKYNDCMGNYTKARRKGLAMAVKVEIMEIHNAK